MEKGDLDSYITEHATLMAELGWKDKSEIACHFFRNGLLAQMVKTILSQEGLPDTITEWVRLAQQNHTRYAMGKALGYYGKNTKKTTWEGPNTFQKKKKE